LSQSGKKLFGTNGVRGIVNEDLTPQLVLDLSRAVAQYVNYQSPVLTGCDGRISSPAFLNLVNAGLSACGCSVETIGRAPTPAVEFLTRKWGMKAGVIVTASHNPPEYNGVKVIGADGIELDRDQESVVEKLYYERRWKLAEWDRVGQITTGRDWLEDYAGSVLAQVDSEIVKPRRLKVVVDPGNGVGILATPKVLELLGCEVATINAKIDGHFPARPSEPLPEHLGALCEAVKANKADYGIAHDGDADRAILVDERGLAHYGDKLFALVAIHVLGRKPKATVVTPVSSSQVIDDVVEQHGGSVEWTKVGSVYVSHIMERIKAPLGGEENGGIFYAGHHPVRDGAMTAALVAEILASEKRKLSELLDDLPQYHNRKAKIQCADERKATTLDQVKKHYSGLKMNEIDGAKVWFPDNSWILIRPSGTEPILRVFSESKNPERADQLLNEAMTVVKNAIAGN
jgi:phosphomannomutase/phosphoglucomutase